MAPDVEAQAIALLEAGFPISAVASRTGVSFSTIKRIKKRHAIKKGAVKAELIDAQRQELMKALDSEWARTQAAAFIHDELALATELRSRLQEAIEGAPAPGDIKEWGLLLRGLTAASTALRNTSDTLHRAIGHDRSEQMADSLPELIVRTLSADEMEAIQAHHDSGHEEIDNESEGVVELH